MCGILGLVAAPGRRLDVSRQQLVELRDTMTARGPDDAGILMRDRVAFAHRRLAIRDREGGAQPWLSDDERTMMIYNGELYNDAELRDSLSAAGVRFRSRCDTEVVMAAYRHWGSGFVERLRGMFALAIYDFRDDSLWLVRDRFGIKPLFLTEVDGCLVFASSIACLVSHPRFQKQPHLGVISHYLSTFRLTLGRETVYRGIWQLLPGEILHFQHGRSSIARYWNYPLVEDESIEYDDALVELDELLDDAVQARLTSDVPVGMFLSGGVDSNTIACQMRRHDSRTIVGHCGGGDTEDSRDFDFAARCARHCDFDYGEARMSQERYREHWEELIQRYRTPLSTPSDVIIYSLARAMKRAVGVVLGGEGADELLCGYAVQHWAGHDYDARRALETGRWKHGEGAAREFIDGLLRQYGRDTFSSPTDHYFALNSLIPTNAKPALFQPWAWDQADRDRRMWDDYARRFERLVELPTSRQHARILHEVNLESLLARLDSSTMEASLEARAPYTDHLLVEKMFRVPHRHKISVDRQEPAPYLPSARLESRGSLRSKRLLRSLAGRMMPSELARRKKASFPTPVQGWLAGPWRQWAGQRLRQSIFARAVFEPQAIDQLADDVSRAGMWLWPMLNITMWGDREFCN